MNTPTAKTSPKGPSISAEPHVAANSPPLLQAPDRVLSTLNKDGSRRWLTPRLSPGRFLSARRWVAIALLLIFTVLPYVRINGHPAILLDITTRHFTIFGVTFLPTDTLLLALFMVGVFVTIFLLTALFGRVWCGWACPQTVYMEFVFRPIERLFEGRPQHRRSGGFQGSGTAKALKYLAFLLVSVYLAHTFLAYFVGVDRLMQWVRQSPFEHPTGFLVMACTTALMMFDFCYFREQTCIVACPYGRFQSVLLDRNSLIISYDSVRGEPRTKARDSASESRSIALPQMRTAGDCVDCRLCVTTCPTGIDIREGLQMECIGCAQCIDACDAVMAKLGRSLGLIRYSSQRAMAGERRRVLRPRVVLYPLILVVIGGLFAMALSRRGEADITVLRGLGRTFTQLPSGEIANQLRVKIVNRTDSPATFAISVKGPAGVRTEIDEWPLTLEPGESRTAPVLVVAPAGAFVAGASDMDIVVTSQTGFTRSVPYRLLGPTTTSASTSESSRGGQP